MVVLRLVTMHVFRYARSLTSTPDIPGSEQSNGAGNRAVTIDRIQRIGLQEKCKTRTRRTLNKGIDNYLLPQCEQRRDQRPLYVSRHRGPQPLATPDGLQPLP